MRGNIYVYALVIAIIAGSLFFEGNISSSQVKDIEPAIIRDDDGEMDNYIKLGDSDTYLIKYLDIEVNPRDYNTAELYIYGKASDCGEMDTGNHVMMEITNAYTSEYIQFDPCDKFNADWSWTTLGISVDALRFGINSFKIKNVQRFESFGDILYIGYDADTVDYDRSKIVDTDPPQTSLTYDFENMIYLKLS